MTPEEIKALSDDELIDAIQEWDDTVRDNIDAQRAYGEYPAVVKQYRLRLENAQTTLAALRAEALRRMPPPSVDVPF